MATTDATAETAGLLRRLEEAEETLNAIQQGAVDAFVVNEDGSSRVYTLEGADRPYRILIERMQQGAAVLNPEGTIIYCNLSLADLLKVPHEKLIGMPLGDFVAGENQSTYQSLLATRDMKGGRAEVELRPREGNALPAYLSMSPLSRTETGEIGAVVTDLTSQKTHAEIVAAHHALHESEEQLRHILDSVLEYAIVSLDGEGRITGWNSGAARLLGYDEGEILGRSCDVFFSPEDRAAGVPEREMRKAGEEGRAADERWHVRKDGSRFWGSGVMMPLERTRGGGYLKIFRDRTEERRAQERQAMLINELNHRVKNTLATVQSLAAQSVQAHDAEGWKNFEARLLALSHAHDLLTRTNWEGAPLRDLLTRELEPYRGRDGARLVADGPDITLEPKIAIVLTMAIHELATNAAKYGALSTCRGEVWVSWRVAPAPAATLKLDWTETGGPPVKPPVRKGFGSRLIERGLALEVDGRARLEFAPHGVICRIEIPLSGRRPL